MSDALGRLPIIRVRVSVGGGVEQRMAGGTTITVQKRLDAEKSGNKTEMTKRDGASKRATLINQRRIVTSMHADMLDNSH